MEDPLITPQPPSDPKRERDVFKLYAAFQDIPNVQNLGCSPDTHSIPSNYVPKPAPDASLAAFCQLAAMRLQTARSLISLLDDNYQYILAEATPQTSLRANPTLNSDLGFGNVRLPRRWGICEKVLDPAALAEGHEGIILINDFSQDNQYAKRSYVKDGGLRFYAGVPLITSSGSIVGAVCVLDDKARNGLSREDIIYLQDLAVIVMEYLDTYIVRDHYRRGSEGLHGLLSFTNEPSGLKSIDRSRESPMRESEKHTSEQNSGPLQESKSPLAHANSFHMEADPKFSPGESSDRRRSVADLQEDLISTPVKELFSRAADIMRQSNDMDGVIFIDASAVNVGFKATRFTNTTKLCQILGFATNELSSKRGDALPIGMTPSEDHLGWVLEHYPHGYNLDCNESCLKPGDGNVDVTHRQYYKSSIQWSDQNPLTAKQDRANLIARVKALIPSIQSALFLPLWNFDRGRCFAGCFCWSIRPERILDERLDLPFLKVFGHSIMQEVARLDAQTTNQAKSTFLASLSHELRTPLHGILGSSHLMRNSNLDSFQISMLNSITVCGRTLLETVEHLLDHAERTDGAGPYSSKVSSTENSICIVSEIPQSNLVLDNPMYNVALVTEEVVETMVIGEAPTNVSQDSQSTNTSAASQIIEQSTARRRSRYIILDIMEQNYSGYKCKLAASSYGRIVMNLFGNALKFTNSGHVFVTLCIERKNDAQAMVVLQIEDTGVGMSRQFLQTAFEPFRKQVQHTTGTGVGLSVVKRILEDVGGQIEICSEQYKGTIITLKLPLESLNGKAGHGQHPDPLSFMTKGLQGRRVSVLWAGRELEKSNEPTGDWQMLKKFNQVLIRTLSEAFQMDVSYASTWDGNGDAEVIICPQVSFDALQDIRQNAARFHRKCPAIVLIAMDVLEAETLRSDARIKSRETIVETITQPCGPYKLSMVLNECLKRYDMATLNDIPESIITPTVSSNSILASGLEKLSPRLGIYASPLVNHTKPKPPSGQPTAPSDRDQLAQSRVMSIEGSGLSRIQLAFIVDDNVINRRLLSTWMKKHKVSYKEAKDGQEALNMFKEANGEFDVILMDISMPVMDGMTSTRLIREYEKQKNMSPSHIIALTGLTSASAKLEAWTSGVDDFMTKPVDFQKLESLLRAGRGAKGTGFVKY